MGADGHNCGDLDMADNIRATPRNPVLGLFSDITQGGLDYLRDPRFRQSMMQLPAPVRPFGMGAVALPGLFESTGFPKTLERAAYGEPLTNIGMANVPTLKPETADLLMNVAPFAPAALRGAAATGRFVAPKAGQLAEGYMQRMGMMPGVVPAEGGGALSSAITEQKILAAQNRIEKNPDYIKLSRKEKAQALDSVRAKIEKTGIKRGKASLMDALNGEEDIADSILTNNAFKITGVIPKSTVDEALATRANMRAQPATTPGAGASEKEWADWGKKYGVNMALTEPKSLGITDLTSKREVRIPGGLEGTFTIPDMFWMKANNIDPASMPKEVHDALMQKLIRTHKVETPDQVDVFNRLNFALLSPNAPLTPNEFLAQRMRLNSMDELQALAGRVGEEGLSRTAQEQTGVQAAARGGMGVLGTANLSNQAMLAKLILQKPEMFQMAPGETMRDVTIRVMNQIPGLGPKTASLGTPWLNLEKANTSAVDLHMIRHSYERMLDDPLVGEAFKQRMAGKLGVEPTTKAILSVPESLREDAAIDVIGGSSLAKNYRTKAGELNAIPDVATPDKLAYEPQKIIDFNPFYKRVVDYVDESRGLNPELELFPEQWRKWDIYRQRLEPHEFAHPDFRSLPRQSWTEMRDALTAHKEAGYTQSDNPVMATSDWRKLYYGKVDPTLLPGVAGAAGAAGLGIDYYRRQQPADILTNELDYPSNPMYTDPLGYSIR